jgi:hypothetical protein
LEKMGAGKHEEYHKLLHRLMEQYGVKECYQLVVLVISFSFA